MDYITSSSKHGEINEALVNLNINGTPCTVTLPKLDALISELKIAAKLIKSVKL